MGEVLPLPNRGEVFLDPRGEGRSLRVSWHRDRSTLVLSLWQLGQCRATFRLDTDEVPNLVRALVSGLADGLADHRELSRQLASQAERAIAPAAPELGPKPPRWDRPPVVQPEAAAAPAEALSDVAAVATPADADPPDEAAPAVAELPAVAEPNALAEPNVGPADGAESPTVPAGPALADAVPAVTEPFDSVEPPTVPVDPAIVGDLPTVPVKPKGTPAIAVSDGPTVVKKAAKLSPADVTGSHPQVTVAPAIFLAPPDPA